MSRFTNPVRIVGINYKGFREAVSVILQFDHISSGMLGLKTLPLLVMSVFMKNKKVFEKEQMGQVGEK